MDGDKLLLKVEHSRLAGEILAAKWGEIRAAPKFTISIGGESGSGKSEIATELSRLLNERGVRADILQMDDYFVYPPSTCHEMRHRNIEQVGPYEAKLFFLDSHLRAFKQGVPDLYKPLSVYGENRLTTEVMPVGDLRVLIAEGTYTTTLKFVDCRVFIDRSYLDTDKDRQRRGRDIIDDLTADILSREHEIITKHRNLADIVIAKDLSGIKTVQPPALRPHPAFYQHEQLLKTFATA